MLHRWIKLWECNRLEVVAVLFLEFLHGAREVDHTCREIVGTGIVGAGSYKTIVIQ